MAITYIFLSINCYSESGVDILQNDPKISYKYQKGRFLLYDCKDKNWVCTRSLENERCKKARIKAIRDGVESYPCAYFTPFQTMNECQNKQLELTNRLGPTVFCKKSINSSD